MILTVTPNSAIDWALFIPHFNWEEPLQADKAIWGMAGKSTSAAWILGELGVDTIAMGFAAGTSGEKMIELLEQKNVETDFIWVSGETRLNVHVFDREKGRQTLLAVDTLEIANAHIERFMKRFAKKLKQAKGLITGGSLPAGLTPDFFREIVTAAKEKGVPVVLDSGFPHFAHVLQASPDLIKLNRAHLSSVVGHVVISIEDAYHAARSILEKYGTQVFVTLDTGGTLAVLKERACRIPVLKAEQIENTAGAEGGILAGIAYALANQFPLEDGIRLGAAASSAVTMTPAAADCRKDDVERLLSKVELIPYP
jgi:1-phosphofructokinase family hexose kinase